MLMYCTTTSETSRWTVGVGDGSLDRSNWTHEWCWLVSPPHFIFLAPLMLLFYCHQIMFPEQRHHHPRQPGTRGVTTRDLRELETRYHANMLPERDKRAIILLHQVRSPRQRVHHFGTGRSQILVPATGPCLDERTPFWRFHIRGRS